MKRIFGIDPFATSCTLSAAVMKGFRHKYLKPNTIQVIPEFSETQVRRQQSQKALRWLAWESKQTGKNIRTAASTDGERRVPCGNTNYWCDDITENQGRIVELWEFYG